MRTTVIRGLLATTLLVAGCPKGRATYMKAYQQHTEKVTIYDGFGTALRSWGTYVTPSMRDAMASERQRLLDPTDADHARFEALMADDDAEYHEVVFTAGHSMVSGRLRFGEQDDGWRIRLEVDGEPEELVTVFKVRKPHALQIALYPQVSEYNELWFARFRKTRQATDKVELHFGSGHGHGSLVWTGDQVR